MKIYALYLLLVAAGFWVYRIHRKRFLIVVFTAVLPAFLWFVSEPAWPFDDLKAYYSAGQQILKDPSALYERVEKGFVNIPAVALLFVPLTWFGLPAAAGIMIVIGFIAVIVSCFLLIHAHGKPFLLIFLFAMNGPLINSIREGNTTHVLLLFLVAALLCLERKRETIAGCILGLAAIIKIPLILFGVYLLLRKRWKAATGFWIALVGTVSLSLVLFGPELHTAWFDQCVRPFAGKPMGAFNVQSIDGTLARLLLHADSWSWQPVEPNSIYVWVRPMILLLLFVPAFWISFRAEKPESADHLWLEFSIVLCLCLLTSPISWTHYYLLLLIPLSLLWSGKLVIFRNAPSWVLILLSTLMVSLPVIPGAAFFRNPNPVLSIFARLFISHYFFGGVVLLVFCLAARYKSARTINAPASR